MRWTWLSPRIRRAWARPRLVRNLRWSWRYFQIRRNGRDARGVGSGAVSGKPRIPRMTMPAPETLEREKDKLYLLDSELIRRLGVPEKTFRSLLPALESKYNFPRKQPLFGKRRYWPAVKA